MTIDRCCIGLTIPETRRKREREGETRRNKRRGEEGRGKEMSRVERKKCFPVRLSIVFCKYARSRLNSKLLGSPQARIQGGGGRPPLGRKDPRLRRGFPRLKGRKKGHWCLLNGCSTPFRHNMAINILTSCKSVFAYVKNRPFPSHIRSSFYK